MRMVARSVRARPNPVKGVLVRRDTTPLRKAA